MMLNRIKGLLCEVSSTRTKDIIFCFIHDYRHKPFDCIKASPLPSIHDVASPSSHRPWRPNEPTAHRITAISMPGGYNLIYTVISDTCNLSSALMCVYNVVINAHKGIIASKNMYRTHKAAMPLC